jgi:hypothetical protein
MMAKHLTCMKNTPIRCATNTILKIQNVGIRNGFKKD